MKKPIPHSLERPGFALVVTLALMILLTIIAVGLLSLSAISLRSSSQGTALSEARANARLALMLAIRELQKEMGPDQRVSASGAIVAADESSVKHPHWTGVWDSWHAGNDDPTNSSNNAKDPLSEHSTIAGAANSGMAPTYQDQRKDHFRSWLLSLNTQEGKSVTSPVDVTLTGTTMPASGADAVQLVGSGSSSWDSVSARLLTVKSGAVGKSSGRYGWWVGDESQKARVMDDSYTGTTPAMAERIFRQQAPGSTGTSTISELKNITDDSQIKNLPSIATLDLVELARAESPPSGEEREAWRGFVRISSRVFG